MENVLILTDCAKIVLDYVQKNDEVFVGKDLIEKTNIKGIYPVLNSLKNKGIIEEVEPVVRDFTNSKGVTKPKEYKTYKLTDFGRNIVL